MYITSHNGETLGVRTRRVNTVNCFLNSHTTCDTLISDYHTHTLIPSHAVRQPGISSSGSQLHSDVLCFVANNPNSCTHIVKMYTFTLNYNSALNVFSEIHINMPLCDACTLHKCTCTSQCNCDNDKHKDTLSGVTYGP